MKSFASPQFSPGEHCDAAKCNLKIFHFSLLQLDAIIQAARLEWSSRPFARRRLQRNAMRQTETCPLPWPPGWENAPEEAELLAGKFAALFHQVGSPDAFQQALFLPLPSGGIGGRRALRDFLLGYQTRVLAPFEMPAIARAQFLSSRGRARELIALDEQMRVCPIPPALASASRRTGRAQLERLRPLRDERTVRRYLAAVQEGRASGWHTLVYGLSLAVYSWPLRSALLTYARATLSSLARAAARPAAIPAPVRREVLQSCFLQLPAAVEQTVAGCQEWGQPLKSL
ncbi:MAG: urease accessory UreF family protein [Verrucomicrobiota bacterium]